MRILVTAGDPRFAHELAEGIGGHGFTVELADTAAELVNRCHEVDAVVTDLKLPDADGCATCRAVRAVSAVPVIVVGQQVDQVDRVLCLRLGADDVMSTPVNPRELAARLEAVIRRATDNWGPGQAGGGMPRRIRQLGPVRIDLRRRHVAIADRQVPLTRKEFDILACLSSDPGRVFDREDIMSRVWGHDGAGDTRTLGVHMAGLRRKLGCPSLIETVRGVGFRLAIGAQPGHAAPRDEPAPGTQDDALRAIA